MHSREHRPRLLTTTEAAEYLTVSPSFLEQARLNGRPEIPFVKIGSRVAYDPLDLDVWVSSHKKVSVSQNAGGA